MHPILDNDLVLSDNRIELTLHQLTIINSCIAHLTVGKLLDWTRIPYEKYQKYHEAFGGKLSIFDDPDGTRYLVAHSVIRIPVGPVPRALGPQFA